jgi:hypothetical protein
LAGSFLLAIENNYKNEAYGQGYNIVKVKDSQEDEEDAIEEADDDVDD